jgi:hypothetical protein
LKYKVEEKDNKEVHGLFVGIIMNMNFWTLSLQWQYVSILFMGGGSTAANICSYLK